MEWLAVAMATDGYYGTSSYNRLGFNLTGVNVAAGGPGSTPTWGMKPDMKAWIQTPLGNPDGSVNREAVRNATGALWVVPAETDGNGNVPANAPEPDIKQLPASDMRNFHDTLSTLGRIGAGLCDLSPSSLGFGVADNPASADGIRASQDDLVTRVERHQQARGNGYERVMRLVMAVEGRDPASATGLETVWRNPATPTRASEVDAAVKMYAAGLVDKHQARVDAGYSATTISAMEEREGSDPQVSAAIASLDAERAAPRNN